MNVDKYNHTVYKGLYILLLLILISFLTYLFKYDNVKYAINFLILFVILLLTILCSSTFKNNVIENYTTESVDNLLNNSKAATDDTILDKRIIDLNIAIADEPFGRLSNSFGFFQNTSSYDIDFCKTAFEKLYNYGYRGFHLYVEYPLNEPDTPYYVVPYKDNNGMNSISTRTTKIKLKTVLDGLEISEMTEPIFLCITCLSTEKENTLNKIETLLDGLIIDKLEDTSTLGEVNVLDPLKLFITLGTYDGIPLTNTTYAKHYFIKETDLKYAAFNVVNGLGLYSPLVKYTKNEQDTFDTRGFDEQIRQSITMAFNNGVQFVCAPPTQKGITIGLADEEKYDYPNTITYYRSYFTHTEQTSGDKTTIPYKLRNVEFLTLLGEVFNSAKYDELDTRVTQLEEP